MEEGKIYTITLVDGEVVKGVYLGPERGFWLIRVDDDIVPLRKSSTQQTVEVCINTPA